MSLEFAEPKHPIDTYHVAHDTDAALTRETIAQHDSDSEELARSCAELSVAARRRRQVFLRWQAGLSAFTLCLTAIISVMVALNPDRPAVGSNFPFYFLLVSLFVSLAGVGGYLRISRRSRKLRSLVESVISADSTATTGALIDVLSVDDTRVAREARRQLTRLAPRWSETDMAELTPEQRDGLRRVIDGVQSSRHGDALGASSGHRYMAERTSLRVALCSALGRLGNDEDLRALKRLARLPAVTSLARQARDAAALAISELDARLAEQNHARNLLRAADAPPSSPAELVRAAGAPAPTPPEQLLRPTLPQ